MKDKPPVSFLPSLSLSRYHRSKAEMRHTCRGTINLATANITVEDSCNFIISNGGAQTYHLKASSEVERQRWVTALELAKAKAVKMLAESGRGQRACGWAVFPLSFSGMSLISPLLVFQPPAFSWLLQAPPHPAVFLLERGFQMGELCPAGDAWQCPETFLLSQLRGGVAVGV